MTPRKLLKKALRAPRSAARALRKGARLALFEARNAAIRKTTATQPGKIAIMTNTYRYTCNPKYIFEELRRQDPRRDIVWLVNRQGLEIGYPPEARCVRVDTPEGIREAYSAQLWLDNGIAFSNRFDKKEDQMHVQTMHGSLGIKTIDNAVLSRNARGWFGRRVVRRETDNTDYVITNSKFEEDVFRRVFWANTPMLRLGHARTDILFSDDEGVISRIRGSLRDRYGIAEDRKIALFAPTHRRGLTADDIYIDYPRLKATLEAKFGGEFAIIVRLHDRTRKLDIDGLDEDFVHDAGDYPDMQELMLATDVGITDYSSWIFDYVLTRRPGFHYVTDIDRYIGRTGLAYPIEESPFPAARDFEQLISAIEQFDETRFHADVEAFLAGKESVDDGRSAQRIAGKLIELLDGDPA